MAGLPINIPVPAESAIASYDWTTLASGLGYVDFYPCCVQDTAGYKGILIEKAIKPSVGTATPFDTYGVFKCSNPNTSVVINCDTNTFKFPRIISGKAYLSFNAKEISGNNPETISGELFIVRGGVETSICTSITSTDIPPTTEKAYCFEFNITQTSFAIGDILRLKLTLTTGSTALAIIMGANPMNETGALNYTKSTLSIPFKIDL